MTTVFDIRNPSTFRDGDPGEWPLFLSRANETQSAPVPPPLPSSYSLARARYVWQSGLARRYVRPAAASFLVVAVTIASAVGFMNVQRRHVGAPNRLAEPLQVASVKVTAIAGVPSAINNGGAVELRIEFLQPQFAAYIAELSNTPEGVAQADAASEPESLLQASAEDGGNEVSALVLRNLPADATLSEGVPAGPGSWVIAASDPNVLVEALRDGFDTEVVAEVEMVSSAGRTLGLIRLPLQKKIAAAPIPVAKAATAAQVPEPAVAEKTVERYRQQARIPSRRAIVAQTRNDLRNQKSQAIEPAESKPAETQQTADASPDKPKPGLISKFMSWLTSGTDDKSGVNSGIRRGLGGPPDE